MDVGEIQADAQHWELDAEKLRSVKMKYVEGGLNPFKLLLGSCFFLLGMTLLSAECLLCFVFLFLIQVSTRDLSLILESVLENSFHLPNVGKSKKVPLNWKTAPKTLKLLMNCTSSK